MISICLYSTGFICQNVYGDEFRKTFSMIGQLRSLIPERINIMALTGTATKNSFDIILQRLGMWEPAIVGVSCNRPSIKLIIQPKQKLEEFGLQISQRLQNEVSQNHCVLYKLQRLHWIIPHSC